MDSLNTILNSGTYGENVSRHNDNNSKIKQAITTLENVAIANKGYFDTLASLQAAFPSPKAGNIAYVANVASSTGYYIYNVVSGVWTATTTEAPAVGVEISNYAQHGYSSSPKTLKQVDDEVVQLAGEVIFDVTANNNGATFVSLSALLSNENLSTLIPTSVRRGGMSIRFIQGSVLNSDNKYVQFRLMSDTFNTTVANWQGIDDVPTAGSDNLVKSGGADKALLDAVYKTNYQNVNQFTENYQYFTLPFSTIVGKQYRLKINATSDFVTNIELCSTASSSAILETLVLNMNLKSGTNYVDIHPNYSGAYLRMAGNGAVQSDNKINSLQISDIINRIDLMEDNIPLIYDEMEELSDGILALKYTKVLDSTRQYNQRYYELENILVENEKYSLRIKAEVDVTTNIKTRYIAASSTGQGDIVQLNVHLLKGYNYLNGFVPTKDTKYIYFEDIETLGNQISDVNILKENISELQDSAKKTSELLGEFGSINMTEDMLLPIYVDLQTGIVSNSGTTIKSWVINSHFGINWDISKTLVSVAKTTEFPKSGMQATVLQTEIGHVETTDGEYLIITISTNYTTSLDVSYIKKGVAEMADRNKAQLVNNRQAKKVGSNPAIISFLYDGDGILTNGVNRDRAVLYPLLKARNLVATFAVHGGSTSVEWYKEVQKEGFGTMVYGGYVGDPYNVNNGVGLSNYMDLIYNAKLSKGWFYENGLACDGFVQYMGGGGSIRDKFFESLFYKYTINYTGTNTDFKFGINNLSEKDVRDLGRLTTDRSSGYAAIYEAIDYAVEHGEWVSLGGHMANTATGVDEWSTLAEFTELLDYIKSLVDQGLLVCVNTDVAFEEMSRRIFAKGKQFHKERPVYLTGDIYFNSDAIKVYTTNTVCAKYKVEYSGSFPAGTVITITEDIGMGGNTNTRVSSYTMQEGDTILEVLTNKVLLRNYVCETLNAGIFFVRNAQADTNTSIFQITTTNGVITVTKEEEQVSALYKQVNLA